MSLDELENELLEKIALTSPTGFYELLKIVSIKSTKTLSKRLKFLSERNLIDWERETKKGRGHKSQIRITKKGLEELEIHKILENVSKSLSGALTAEKEIIIKQLIEQDPIMLTKLAFIFAKILESQNEIVKICNEMQKKNNNFIFLSREEFEKLQREAIKARLSFAEHCKRKLLS
jgi:DNA-binding HxlR family transcriptional regulator